MIDITNTVTPSTKQWERVIAGMRNPMNSWDKSDTGYFEDVVSMGDNDYKLIKRLRNAGTDHRKFMRMIVVYADILAPLYWWKEFDTYKVGTVANSCSTMHKIADKRFTLDDFSHENLTEHSRYTLNSVIDTLNRYRGFYINSNSEEDWWQMIQLLPSSYNQKRTVMLNYEVLANIYSSRKNHKLDEWRVFCAWIEMLPFSWMITNNRW